MKISNSKKELARIISENGGWRDGAANWAAMDGLRNATYNVAAYGEIPVYEKVKKWHKPSDFTAYHEDWFQVSTAIKNFHQTILSSAEYLHLYPVPPVPDADGWIECGGGECPVNMGTLIDVKYRDGHLQLGCRAKSICDTELYATTHWGNSGGGADIIAYRLHNHEQAKPEFCESVMRSIPEPEAKPTIEQLAADYRNAKDYAERKQQEADAAKADADAKLKALELAAEAIGFSLAPIAEKHEPALVITDLLDLLVGDRIWIGDSGSKLNCPEGEYEIVEIDNEDQDQRVGVEWDGGICWPQMRKRNWKFINRQ